MFPQIKTSILVFLFLTVVRGDVDYFTQPAMRDQEFTAGDSTQFVVSQLPDIDRKTIYANVYAEETQEWVMTIEEWPFGSVSDNEKNNFTFDWDIPEEMNAGRYYAKMDVDNDQDDNDICRSKTFIITRKAARPVNSNFAPRPANFAPRPAYRPESIKASRPYAGQRYSNGNRFSALHLRRA